MRLCQAFKISSSRGIGTDSRERVAASLWHLSSTIYPARRLPTLVRPAQNATCRYVKNSSAGRQTISKMCQFLCCRLTSRRDIEGCLEPLLCARDDTFSPGNCRRASSAARASSDVLPDPDRAFRTSSEAVALATCSFATMYRSSHDSLLERWIRTSSTRALSIWLSPLLCRRKPGTGRCALSVFGQHEPNSFDERNHTPGVLRSETRMNWFNGQLAPIARGQTG